MDKIGYLHRHVHNESKAVPDGPINLKIGFYAQFDVYRESGKVGRVYIPVRREVGRSMYDC